MAKGIKSSYNREEQAKLCLEAFETYDPHKKGYLTRLELMAFANELNTSLGHDNVLNQIQENKILRLLDNDGNGTIERNELIQNFDLIVAVLKIPSQKMGEIVKRSFFIYDIELKGYLSR
jgi:Ca2+-binding EF-hand superfamily protein